MLMKLLFNRFAGRLNIGAFAGKLEAIIGIRAKDALIYLSFICHSPLRGNDETK
jgi:hypothetical protein